MVLVGQKWRILLVQLFLCTSSSMADPCLPVQACRHHVFERHGERGRADHPASIHKARTSTAVVSMALRLRSGGNSNNSGESTSSEIRAGSTTTTTGGSSSTAPPGFLPSSHHPKAPSNSNKNNNNSNNNKAWSDTILQIRESVWETQEALGTALHKLKNRSLEVVDDDLEEEERDATAEGSYCDYGMASPTTTTRTSSDSDGVTQSTEDEQLLPSLAMMAPPPPVPRQVIATTTTTATMIPNTLQHQVDGWAVCAVVSTLLLATCIRCYELLSRHWHWDFDFETIIDLDWDNVLYNLESYLEVGHEIVSLVASSVGIMTSLHAACLFALLTIYGRRLVDNNNNHKHHQHHPYAGDHPLLLAKPLRSLQRSAYRSFHRSFYMVGLQLILLLPSRLPWMVQRVLIVGMVLMLGRMVWDVQSIGRLERKNKRQQLQLQQQRQQENITF